MSWVQRWPLPRELSLPARVVRCRIMLMYLCSGAHPDLRKVSRDSTALCDVEDGMRRDFARTGWAQADRHVKWRVFTPGSFAAIEHAPVRDAYAGVPDVFVNNLGITIHLAAN